MTSEIIIVDKEDNKIGSKNRDEINNNDIYRVSALWIKNSEGKSLLARRSFKKKKHPGEWGPAVAGTIEKGETYDANIIKEAKEELGLENLEFQKGPKLISVSGTHFTQWYFLTIDKPIKEFTIQKEEVEEIKWFSKEEFLEEFNKNPKEFLKSVLYWFNKFSDEKIQTQKRSNRFY